jgi:hypothetical protein
LCSVAELMWTGASVQLLICIDASCNRMRHCKGNSGS